MLIYDDSTAALLRVQSDTNTAVAPSQGWPPILPSSAAVGTDTEPAACLIDRAAPDPGGHVRKQILQIAHAYKTGLYKVGGTLKYYEEGTFKSVTGLVKKPSGGKLYYVKDGVYAKKFTGVAQLINTNKYYVVHKGKADLKANGLLCVKEYKYSNGWYTPKMVLYKVKKGKLTKKAALPKLSKSVKGADKNTQAKNVARKIVKNIIGYNKEQKIDQVAKIVSLYSNKARYTMKGKDYSTAYGVFVKGEYSCAGSTRALGMLLDLMGYKWKHVNANQYKHQWVELKINGKKAWADGQIGEIGYGKRF